MMRKMLLAAMGVALLSPVAMAQSSMSSVEQGQPGANQPSSPYAEIREVPAAAAAAAGARAEVQKAKSQIHFAILSLQMDLEQSEAWRSANQALASAHRQYTHERERVLRSVEARPEYQRARATAEAYGSMITELKRLPDADGRNLLELASHRMNAGAAASSMESEALLKDEAYQSARTALVEANERVEAMRRQMQRSVRQDEAWQSARASLLDARVRAAATAAYYTHAVDAAESAVDFAAYQAHQVRYRPVIGTTIDNGYGTWRGSYRLGYPIYWHHK